MVVGRRRPEPEQGHGSGITIGGINIASLQNVVGQNISNVQQSACVESPTVSMETVRDLLAAFRTEVDQNGSVLPNGQVLRAMADSIDTLADGLGCTGDWGAARGCASVADFGNADRGAAGG